MKGLFAKYINLVLLICILMNTGCTEPHNNKEGKANGWQLRGFSKIDSVNPILTPTGKLTFIDPIKGKAIAWDERNVLNPAAVVRDDTVYLFYRAQDASGTSRIGLATSLDGIHFTRRMEPVFYPDKDAMQMYEWSYLKEKDPDCGNCFDGVEDPRIVETEDGSYVMTYTAYDGKTARLALAVSEDLIHWDKKGLVLRDSLFRDTWSKSGAIVCRQEGNQMVAQKINGQYWMYYGDTDLYMAVSEDLINWKPFLNKENGKHIRVLHPRPGYFDSRLVEPGPFALLTDDGILLIYNSSNAANANDTSLPNFTYSASQALYAAKEPYKLIERAEDYFIHPEKDYEITGEVNQVCFVEGLVHLNGTYFLYYGTADSRIAVAVADSGY